MLKSNKLIGACKKESSSTSLNSNSSSISLVGMWIFEYFEWSFLAVECAKKSFSNFEKEKIGRLLKAEYSKKWKNTNRNSKAMPLFY